MLDNELNNSPVYRLVGLNNVNSSDDNVSLWRRFKKACTRAVVSTYRFSKGIKTRKPENGKAKELADDKVGRPSTDTRPTIRTSIYSERTSFHSTRSNPNDIQMTPVPSPGYKAENRPDGHLMPSDRPKTAFSFDDIANGHVDPAVATQDAPSSRRVEQAAKRKSTVAPLRDYGSLVDSTKETSGTARFKRDFLEDRECRRFCSHLQ